MSKTKTGTKIPKKPVVDAPKDVKSAEEKSTTQINVIDATKFMEEARSPKEGGLDANHRVELAVLNYNMFVKDPDARKKYGDSTVDSMNEITAVMAISETVTEVVAGRSAFAHTIKKAYLPQLINVAGAMGIIIDQKLLPAVKEGEETVEIPAEAFKPNEEVKEDIKKDIDINNKKPELDVTKIETEEDFKKALTFILGETNSPMQNINKAIEFYRSVKSLEASKKNDKNSVEKIRNASINSILEEVLKIVDKVPFITIKIADNMRTITGVTKSVVPAFCTMRDAVKNRKTGIPTFDDQTVASIVRTLVIYSAQKQINVHKKDLEVLNTNKEQNATAIEDKKRSIVYLESIIEIVVNPSVENINEIIENYDNRENAEGFKTSHRIFSNVAKTYYGSTDLKTVKQDILKQNIKTYIGLITNLFRDPLSKIEGYSEANIVELEFIEPAKDSEEKK